MKNIKDINSSDDVSGASNWENQIIAAPTQSSNGINRGIDADSHETSSSVDQVPYESDEHCHKPLTETGDNVNSSDDSDSEESEYIDITIEGYVNTSKEIGLYEYQGIKFNRIFQGDDYIGIMMEDSSFIEKSKIKEFVKSMNGQNYENLASSGNAAPEGYSGNTISHERHVVATIEDFIKIKDQQIASRTANTTDEFVKHVREYLNDPTIGTPTSGEGICGVSNKDILKEIYISVLKSISVSGPTKNTYFPIDFRSANFDSDVKKYLENINGKVNLKGEHQKAIRSLLPLAPLSENAKKSEKTKRNSDEVKRKNQWERNVINLSKAFKRETDKERLRAIKDSNGDLHEDQVNWLNSLLSTDSQGLTSSDKIKICQYIEETRKQFTSINNFSFDNKHRSIDCKSNFVDDIDSDDDSDDESVVDLDFVMSSVKTIECIVDGELKVMPKRYFWTKAYAKENIDPVDNSPETTSIKSETKNTKFDPYESIEDFKKGLSKLKINSVLLCYLMHRWSMCSFDRDHFDEYLEVCYLEIFMLGKKYLARETGFIRDLIQHFFDNIGFDDYYCHSMITNKYQYIVQKQMLERESTSIKMHDEQIEFVNNLRKEIEMFSRGPTDKKRLHFCGSTFGGGKTSMATAVADHLSNRLENVTICIVLPSKQLVLDFTKHLTSPFYILRWSEKDFPEIIAPHDNVAPMYTETKFNNKQSSRVFKYADQLRNMDIPLVEKMKMIQDFNPSSFNDPTIQEKERLWVNNTCLKNIIKANLEIPRTGIDGSTLEPHPYSTYKEFDGQKIAEDKSNTVKKASWHQGRERYKSPKILFCDIGSAVHLNNNLDGWKSEFGKDVYFIIDECVACCDTNVDPEYNRMMKAFTEFYSNPPKSLTIMSASLTSEDVRSNYYFRDFEHIESSPIKGTNSFAQLQINGKPVNPFNGLDLEGFNESISHWNSNCNRCFTPQMIWAIFNRFNKQFIEHGIEEITSNDLSNPIKFLDLVDRIIEATKRFDDRYKKDLIRFIPNFRIDMPTSDDKKLIIASGKLDEVVMKALGDTAITRAKIEEEVQNEKRRRTIDLKDLKKKLDSNTSKISSGRNLTEQQKAERSVDAIEDAKNEIHYLEKCISSEEFDITLETSLGKITLSHGWRTEWLSPKQKDKFGDKQISLSTCGIKGLRFPRSEDGEENNIVFWASRTSYPHGLHRPELAARIDTVTNNVVVDISHMYGLNDHSIRYVKIDDPEQILGIDTLLQGIARACRSKEKNPIAVAEINWNILNLFKFNGNSSLLRLHEYRQGENFIVEKQKFCDLAREDRVRREEESRLRSIRIQEERERERAYQQAKLARENAERESRIARENEERQSRLATMSWSDVSRGDQGMKQPQLQAVVTETTSSEDGWVQAQRVARSSASSMTSQNNGATRDRSSNRGNGYRGNRPPPCKWFFGLMPGQKGRGCRHGDQCRFSHSAVAPNGSSTTRICFRYMNGTCNSPNCNMYHPQK